jgi:hypothetical protein
LIVGYFCKHIISSFHDDDNVMAENITCVEVEKTPERCATALNHIVHRFMVCVSLV